MKNTKVTKKNKGVSGLVNLGNTSHINAMIQLLSHVPSIKNFYRTLHERVEKSINLPSKSTKKFSYLLASLMHEIWSGEYRVLKPSVYKII
jgi:ubiquitin C-terminal hydrolase